MTRNSKKLIMAAAVTVFLVVGIAVLLPALIRARTTSASNACVNNLRQIDGAKHGWALEYKKLTNAVVTWDNIRGYVGRGPDGEILVCPRGGTYALGRIGEPPTCSYPGHNLQ
jgi:hypothetical protein